MLVIDIWQLMFPELPQRTCHSTMTNKLFPRFMLTIKVPCIVYRELNIEMFTRKRNQAERPKIKKKKRKTRNKFDGKEIVVSAINCSLRLFRAIVCFTVYDRFSQLP